ACPAAISGRINAHRFTRRTSAADSPSSWKVMSQAIELTKALIARRSVTPADEGCQQIMTERLAAAGFRVERLSFGNVENFWARHGTEAPVFCFAGHADVVPTGPLEEWRSDPFAPEIRD